MARKWITAWLLMALVQQANAQMMNTLSSFRNIASDAYVRLSYDNDFFSAKDQYYTQGIDLELVMRRLKDFPVRYLLINPKFGYTRYGVGVQHNGFTPSSISSNVILYNDRPFAGTLVAKAFLIGIDTARRQRFTSSVVLGVIGPAASTKQMQEVIHKSLNNLMPHGWEYQIHNDIAANYEVGYEKQLFSLGNYLMMSGDGRLRLGTLDCRAVVGATLMAGYFFSPFDNKTTTDNSLRIYGYCHPDVSFNGYDATLQGGMLNRTSPYTLFSKEIEGVTFHNRAGVAASYGRFFVEYFTSFSTRDFVYGRDYSYGGIQVAMGL